MNTKTHTVWLFCRVIDNFGDIGVSWRLARQLQQEQGLQVVLWVDEVQALQSLLPVADVSARHACYEGITVLQWRDAFVAEFGIPYCRSMGRRCAFAAFFAKQWGEKILFLPRLQ